MVRYGRPDAVTSGKAKNKADAQNRENKFCYMCFHLLSEHQQCIILMAARRQRRTFLQCHA